MADAPPLKVLRGRGSEALVRSAVRALVDAGHEVLTSLRARPPAILIASRTSAG